MDMRTILLLALAGGALLLLAVVTHFSGQGSLNNIKSKTVGDGQHGTARWATKKEIRETYAHVPFQPELWRKGKDLPQVQGLVLGCVGGKPDGNAGVLAEIAYAAQKHASNLLPKGKKGKRKAGHIMTALVDGDDIHCLMIGASGVGKTAFFL